MRQTRLVFLGDSVTVGKGFSGVTAETRYLHSIELGFHESGLEIEVIPSALEGIDTGYALKRFARLVTRQEPDMVVVLLGLNDIQPPGNRASTSPEQYQQHLMGLVDRVLSIDAKPLLVAPNPRFAIEAPSESWHRDLERGQQYTNRLLAVAGQFQLGSVNLFAKFLEDLRGDLTRLPELIPDGVHPNATGHQLIATTLLDFLLPQFGGQPIQAGHSRGPLVPAQG